MNKISIYLYSSCLVLAILFACSTLKYSDDLGYLNSAQAGYMDFLVRINNYICKDIQGKPGLCSTRIASNQSIIFTHEPRPYSYKFVLTCSSRINSNLTMAVPTDTPMRVEIAPERFADVQNFTCIGEIHPQDRDPQLVSMTWQVTVAIYDANYRPREIISKDEKRQILILGQHALWSKVCDKEGCKDLKKTTTVPITGEIVTATSESYMGRSNYHGY